MKAVFVRVETRGSTGCSAGCGSALVLSLVLSLIAAGPSHAADPIWKDKGRWSATKEWSLIGTHLALLHGPDTTTYVLNLPGEPSGGGSPVDSIFVWRWRSDTTLVVDPADFTEVTPRNPPLGNMFCAGHSALADGRLFVTGGQGPTAEGIVGNRRANIFDPKTLAWTSAPDLAVSRYYPSNVTLADGDVMTFSGFTFRRFVAVGGSDGADFRNTVHLNAGLDNSVVLGTSDETIAGAPFSARAYHSAVFDFNNAHVLNETKGSYPPGYQYLARAIVFGGEDANGVKNDVWNLRWDEVNNEWTSEQLFPAGDPTQPVARKRHGAALLVDTGGDGSVNPPLQKMFIHGGTNVSGVATPDAWWLDLASGGSSIGGWHRITPTYVAGLPWPGRRTGHTMAAIRKGSVVRLIVIGGRLGGSSGPSFSDTVWALNIPDDVNTPPSWNVMRVGGPMREGHVAALWKSDSAIVLFGGNDPDSLRSDVWAFVLGDSTWVPVTPAAGPDGRPTARYLHTGGFGLSNTFIVTGGATTTEPGGAVGDVWSFTLPTLLAPGAWRRDFAALPTGPRFGTAGFVDLRYSPVARVPERYSIGAPAWQPLGTLDRYLPYYPYLYLLPNGILFHAGPDSIARLLDPNNSTWGATFLSDKNAGSSVQYRPWKVLNAGSMSLYKLESHGASRRIDLSAANPGWVDAGVIDAVGRTEENLTILPDGDILMTGGTRFQGAGPFRRAARMWDSGEESWSPNLAEEAADRDYHSAAILLPDGRVLSAGGAGANQQKTADLYEPPYLFDQFGNYAKRPIITAAPESVYYGYTFDVWADSAAVIQKVTLIRPGAVTHAFNQDQRFVGLTFSVAGANRLSVVAPTDSSFAPPGNYLLFLVNDRGTPAIAKWVRLWPTGGGCPTLDVRTAGGWAEENTILSRSPEGFAATDQYRLKSVPVREGERYRVRIRENGNDYTTLDQVALRVVDHPRNQRALAMGNQVILGSREPAHRVTTRTGRDITHLVDGSSRAHFVGEPGETLLVDLSLPPLLRADIDPFEMDPGGKGGGGNPFTGGNEAMTIAESEALVLATTGILVQGRMPSGEWVTVRQRVPRAHFDECLIDTLDQGPVRLVFVGRHSLRFVGRVNPVAAMVPPGAILRSATHCRLGDVLGAVRAADGEVTVIGPGDTLSLEFDAPREPSELQRDVFVLSRGSYSSGPPQSFRATGAASPLQFALEQNQPNPFDGTTTIGFVLPARSAVRLTLYDTQGRRVRELAMGEWEAGRHEVAWNRRDDDSRLVRPGVYWYELVAGANRARRKMVVLP